MKRNIILACSAFLLFSCKKETVDVEHTVQFQSNVLTINGGYSLLIDNASSDISSVYKLNENSTIQLTLFRDTSIAWMTATIFVDGKAVKYDEGYKDTIAISYTIK